MTKPNAYYNPEQLAMLSRVLNEALRAGVDFNGASTNDEEIGEFATLLGRVIISRYEAGGERARSTQERCNGEHSQLARSR